MAALLFGLFFEYVVYDFILIVVVGRLHEKDKNVQDI
jgi:hypothetical protein